MADDALTDQVLHQDLLIAIDSLVAVLQDDLSRFPVLPAIFFQCIAVLFIKGNDQIAFLRIRILTDDDQRPDRLPSDQDPDG